MLWGLLRAGGWFCVVCVCCFSFLTKRLVLASLSVSFLGSGGRYKVRLEQATEVKILQAEDTWALGYQGA